MADNTFNFDLDAPAVPTLTLDPEPAAEEKAAPAPQQAPAPEQQVNLGPEEQAIEQERYNSGKDRMAARLSPLERQVLGLYLQGLSYAAIGVQLGRTTKSVENALGRARAKLRRNLP